MKQKLNYILTLLLLFSSFSLMAQRPSMEDMKAMKDKFRADKVAFLTTRMDLTPAEAEKFWPVYNEFDSKRVDIQITYLSLERRILDNREQLSDEEITNFVKTDFAKKQEEEELNAKYYEKFLKILPPKKVFTLYKAEKDYYRYLDMKRGGNRNNFNNR